MKKKAAIIVLDGFEEIEAIAPIDVLRRVGVDIVIAGEKQRVSGSHNVIISTDESISQLSPDLLDCIILPGGMPGSVNLKNNPHVIRLLRQMNEKGKLICAICAAPIALAEAGIINNIKVTSYPSFHNQLGNAKYTGARVEHDKNIITACGPGAALDFAFKIASELAGKSKIDELRKGMLAD